MTELAENFNVPLSLIVARADNGVIGADNRMPWHIPAELAWFKEHTMGKPMIMGRKTFESLGRVLPGRPHVVISRQALTLPERCYPVPSVAAAISTAAELVSSDQASPKQDSHNQEIMVIGGAEIYRQTLPLAQRLYLTEVHLEPEGDTYFPEFEPADWVELERHQRPAAAEAPAYSLVIYQRRQDR